MQMQNLQDVYNRFEVDITDIRRAIAEALSRGGDYCDLYFQQVSTHTLRLEDHAVNHGTSFLGMGVGIRVLKGDQTGYCYTEEVTPESLKQTALTAAAVASGNGGIVADQFNSLKSPNYYPIGSPWEDVTVDRKVAFIQKIDDLVFSLDPRVIQCDVMFANAMSHVLIATSEGKIAHDCRPMVQVSVGCTAAQNGKREQNRFSLSGRYGGEFLIDETITRLASETVNQTMVLFDAGRPEPGQMELVLAAGSSGILLHEAIGHGMEADFNRKKISIFSDQIGKPVAQPFVTIVDDATVLNSRGALNVDDEANPTQKTVLVENGILRSYLHDRISARFYGVKPTGNGRRESFRYPPLPRMRNTYMAAGPHSKEQIIGSVKKGLYARTFTNGEVAIGAGDFTFYVKYGHLIENGRLTRPVKDVNIIGNGPDVLKHIVMVGDDLELSSQSWGCGKNGQTVPVSLGLPTVKVASITVGGQVPKGS